MDEAVEHEDEPKRPYWHMESMPTRVYLMRDLAAGMSQTDAARKYGVTQPGVSRFATRHRDQIEAIRHDLDNEYAGLWVAERAGRLESYQGAIELVERHLAEYDNMGAPPDPKLLAALYRALRGVGEELGQLKTVIDTTATVRYEVVGVDPAVLR